MDWESHYISQDPSRLLVHVEAGVDAPRLAPYSQGRYDSTVVVLDVAPVHQEPRTIFWQCLGVEVAVVDVHRNRELHVRVFLVDVFLPSHPRAVAQCACQHSYKLPRTPKFFRAMK